MKIDRSSILYKVLTPIFILIGVVTIVLFLAVQRIAQHISEDYRGFTITAYSREIQRVLDTAVTELTMAQVLDKPQVLEAKKKSVIEGITLYWSNNRLDGCVIGPGERMIASSLDEPHTQEIMSRHAQGQGYFEDYVKRIQGKVIRFPAWEWDIVTLTRPITPYFYRREAAFLLPLVTLASVLMGAGVYIVLKKNIRRPVDRMISDIRTGEEIGRTNIAELDTIGDAINGAFRKIFKKTEQCQLLHNLAISIHENLSTEELLNLILDRAGQLIKAGIAAIALYDEKGTFKKILTRGIPPELEKRTPEGKGILELIHLSRKPLRINDVMGHPAFSGSFPDGHPIVKNILGYPIYSDEGKSVGALYFGNKAEGFTEEDESILAAISADAAIALNKAERLAQLKRFKEVIDSAFDVIVITDEKGMVLYANPAFETVTGYLRLDVVGKTTNILKSDYHSDTFYQHLIDTITTGRAWRGEFINSRKDGSIYYSSAIVFPIETEEGINYVSIQRDISQEKKLYEQLIRAQKMEAIGTLAGGIAHDFNNLLAGIMGYSEILLSQTKEGDAFHKAATIINTAGKRGAELAKKILMVTRKEKMETRPVNINEIIKSSAELLRMSVPKDIEIVLNLKDDMPLMKADPTQMQQVIMNLAVNARDAMPEGGRLVIETSLAGAENGAANGLSGGKGAFIKLSVSDTGTGMNVETQRKIFDPFFTTKETGKGTGLGLYIVHSVVNNHGGYINLYSEPGKGTRFNLYLPFTRGLEPEESEVPADLRGTGTILVIDDEAHIRDLCKDMLEPFGYKVVVAEDGAEGINTFRTLKDRISLVVLDMIMPKMGGNEVFQALKMIQPDVKVLLCSGYSHSGFAGIDTIMQSGAKGFIQKPFTRQSIIGEIKKILS